MSEQEKPIENEEELAPDDTLPQEEPQSPSKKDFMKAYIEDPDNGMTDGQRAAARLRLGRQVREPLPRQKKFLRLVAEGESPTQAYKKVYAPGNPRTARSNSHKLINRPDMQRWLQQYRAEAGQRADVTIDEVIYNLRRARDEAFNLGKYNDAIRASELLGKYIKMFDGKVTLEEENPFNRQEHRKRMNKLAKAAGKVVPFPTHPNGHPK